MIISSLDNKTIKQRVGDENEIMDHSDFVVACHQYNEYLNIFACKEEAVQEFDDGYYEYAFVFRDINIKFIKSNLNLLEKIIGIPKSQFKSFKLNNYTYLTVINEFWLNRLINFDALCCIIKILKSAYYHNPKLEVKQIEDLENYSYFLNYRNEVLFILNNIKEIPNIFQVETDRKFLINFNWIGLLSAVRNSKKKV